MHSKDLADGSVVVCSDVDLVDIYAAIDRVASAR